MDSNLKSLEHNFVLLYDSECCNVKLSFDTDICTIINISNYQYLDTLQFLSNNSRDSLDTSVFKA